MSEPRCGLGSSGTRRPQSTPSRTRLEPELAATEMSVSGSDQNLSTCKRNQSCKLHDTRAIYLSLRSSSSLLSISQSFSLPKCTHSLYALLTPSTSSAPQRTESCQTPRPLPIWQSPAKRHSAHLRHALAPSPLRK